MRRPLCLIALVLAAAVRLSIAIWPPGFVSYHDLYGKEVGLTGTVTAKEFRKNSGQDTYLQITLSRICDVSGMDGSQKRTYHVLCLATDDPDYADRVSPVGARIRVEGTMRPFEEKSNPGEFDSRLYYRIQNIEFRLTDIHILAASASADPLAEHLYYAKRYLASVLDHCCHEKDAQVLKAMLLGEKGMIDAETKELYQGSGIIHILSISGLHVSLLAMGLYTLLRKIHIPGLPASILSVTVLLLYSKMTGMGASTFRAAVMFVMYMTAKQIHRTYDLLTGAAVAGILLILQQPLYLLHSGFLFSFGAVISIGLLAPALPDKFSFLSVPLANLPVYLSFYYTFPLYSLMLNLVVIPLMSIVMISAVLAMGIGAAGEVLLTDFLLTAAKFAAEPASIVLRLYEFLCGAAKRLPGYTLVLGAPQAWQVFVYLGMLAVFVYVQDRDDIRITLPAVRFFRRPYVHENPAKESERWKHFFGCLWLSLAVIILCLRFRSGLYLDFLDVGQGDGIYMECEGTRIFIDGGSTTKKDLAKYQIEPFLKHEGAGTVDMLILTHDDEDHCSGMKEIVVSSDMHIRNLVLPDIADSLKGKNYLALERAAKKRDIPVSYISRGGRIQAGKLTLKCLAPVSGKEYSGVNAACTVLLARYGKFSCLLTGDLEKDGEEDFLKYVEGSLELKGLTVLKVAHHGSKYATSDAFLESVSAKYAVISCGWRNTYGHPARETLGRLRDAGMEIFDTRYAGCVRVRTDGERVSVQGYK